MGVHGLWNLLEPSGKPVPLESLENKVLAVDVSIWLHQLVSGYQDSRGNAVPNAHLLGLFHRICKLLFYKIKPVFVFDGDVPLLKKQTVAERQRQKSKLRDDADDVRLKLAKNILKYAAVKEALGSDSASSRVKLIGSNPRHEADIFDLPPLQTVPADEESNGSELDCDLLSSGSSDSSDVQSPIPGSRVHADVHSIDVNGEDFKSLPADIRHDILTELKDTRKQSSWGRMHEMPEDSSQFSSFQMKRLLKRRNFQVSLEETEKEMGGHTMSLAELEVLLNDQGVLVNKNVDLGNRIASDSVTRFVYIRDEAKKALFSLATNDDNPKSPKTTTGFEPQSEQSVKKLNTSSSESPQRATTTNLGNLMEDDEFEQDWSSHSESDEETNKQTNVTNGKSRVDLARDFMFCTSALTQDQINKIVQRNVSPRKQLNSASTGSSSFNVIPSRYVTVEEDSSIFGPSTSKANMCDASTSIVGLVEEELDYIGIISDESDSNDDQVEENQDTAVDPGFSLEVVVQPDKEYNIEEDMFADIFSNIEHDLKQAQPTFLFSQKILVDNKDDKKLTATNTCTEDVLSDIDQSLSPTYEDDSKNKRNMPHPSISYNENVVAILTKEGLFNESSQADLPKCTLKSSENLEFSVPLEKSKHGSATNIDTKTDSQLDLDSTDSVPSDVIVHEDITFTQNTPALDAAYSPRKIVLVDSYSSVQAVNENNTKGQCSESTQDNPTGGSRDSNCIGSDIEEVSAVKNVLTSPASNRSLDDTPVGQEPLMDKNEVTMLSLPKQLPLPTVPKLSTAELHAMQASLEDRHTELLLEKGKSDRMAATITQQMCSQAQDLLRLFGLPYLIAPMEAEAQCAFLDLVSLTDGTISDDSDIWLFGGRKVYKNFFNQKKHVMQFTDTDIHNRLRLARHQMILLALLTGSDYTSGLTGVGPVTALEILAAFPCGGEGRDQATLDDFAVGLRHFREWLQNGRPAGPGTTKLRNKLKDLQLNDGFPSSVVIEGYLRPTVDESREKFTWGKPDVARLQEYTRQTFGWTRLKTDEILTPVLNKLTEKNSQASLDSYFKVGVKFPQGDSKLSKRVQKAVNRLGAATHNTNSDTEDDPLPLKKRRLPKLEGSNQRSLDKLVKDQNKIRPNRETKIVKAKSEEVGKKESNVAGRSCGELIPQREQDKLNALKSKLKAIELYRNSKMAPIKTKKLKRPNRIEKAEAELSESSSD